MLINNLLSAEQYPGAQLYPVCVQVEVTGTGAAFPTSFVSFPGAYTPDTPGTIPSARPIEELRFLTTHGKRYNL